MQPHPIRILIRGKSPLKKSDLKIVNQRNQPCFSYVWIGFKIIRSIEPCRRMMAFVPALRQEIFEHVGTVGNLGSIALPIISRRKIGVRIKVRVSAYLEVMNKGIAAVICQVWFLG